MPNQLNIIDTVLLEHEFQYCCEICDSFYKVDFLCENCGKWFSVYECDVVDEKGNYVEWDINSAMTPPEGIVIKCNYCKTKYKYKGVAEDRCVMIDDTEWMKIK